VNRKELVRQYKERRSSMGVYRVRNTVTGNAIVAAATDLTAILNRHQAQLRMDAHASRALQADWRAHGPGSFVFEVLDTLSRPDDPGYDPVPDLTALEELWLDQLSMTVDRVHSINPRRLR
jgi:hypothetical protein